MGVWDRACSGCVIVLAELIRTCMLLLQANPIVLDVEAFNQRTRYLNSEDRTELSPLFRSQNSSVKIFKVDATNRW